MKRFVNVLFVNLVVCLIAVSGLTLEAFAQIEQKQDQENKLLKAEDSIFNRYIVVLNDRDEAVVNIQSQEQVVVVAQSLARAHAGKVDHVYYNALKGFSIEMSEKEAAALSKDAKVKYVVEDAMIYLSDTQNNAPWGLDRIDQRNRPLSSTYNYTATGSGVRAYVIDTGVLPSHSDFGGRASIGADFVDDGRNGIDCNGHGTHVAGTIAGNTYGVAKQASIVAVRVFGCTGSTSSSTIIAAMDWVQVNRVLPAVVNMSLSGGGHQATDDAARSLINSGVTVVVAAGNDYTDASSVSPARVREAITVGATDINDNRANFSNYGSAVDLFAPGVNIVSSWYTSNTASVSISGTSMATPHVAGAAAKYLSRSPGSSPAQVQSAIVGGSTSGIVGNAGANSPNILLASEISSNDQVTNGTYKITNKRGGRALDVEGGLQSSDARIQLYDYDNWNNQKWRVEALGDGSYSLIAVHSNKALDACGGNDSECLIQYDWNGGDNQRWLLEPVGDNYYQVISKQTRRALDATNDYNNASVILYPQHSNENQRWKFDLLF